MINKQLNKSFYTSVYKNELHSSAGEPAFGEFIVECEIYRYTNASNLDLKKRILCISEATYYYS